MLSVPLLFERAVNYQSVKRKASQDAASQSLQASVSLSDRFNLTMPQEKVRYREEMIEGLERAPAAFVGLLKGEAFGKRVVKLNA